MKSKVLASGLVFSLLACTANLLAKERRGAELIVYKFDGQQQRGELIAVKQESLLLLDFSTSIETCIDILDIKAIRIEKKANRVLAVSLGLVIGGAAGTAAGYGLGMAFWHEGDPAWPWAGGIIGLLSGVSIGMLLSYPETIEVEGKSIATTKEILMKLRSKARIMNFQ